MSFRKQMCAVMLLFAAVCAAVLFAGAAQHGSYAVNDGAIDLRTVPDVPVSLSGRWEFYWHSLIADGEAHTPDALVSVAGDWQGIRLNGQRLGSFGAATYRLKVYARRGQKLAINIRPQRTAWRLFVNGALLNSGGQVSLNAKEGRADYNAKMMTVEFEAPADEFYLNLQISNYQAFQAGVHTAPVIGLPAVLNMDHAVSSASISVLFGTVIIQFMFCLVLALRGENRGAVLSYGLLSLAVPTLIVISPNAYTDLPFSWPDFHARWASLTAAGVIGGALLLLYLRYTYPDRLSRVFARAALLTGVALTAAAVVLPDFWVTVTVYVSFRIVLAELAASIWLLVRAARQKRRYAFTQLLACAALLPLVANDVFSPFVPMLVSDQPLTVLGTMLMLFCMAGMHAHDFCKRLEQERVLVRRLEQTQRLREEFVERTASQLRAPAAQLFVIADTPAQDMAASEQIIAAQVRRESRRLLTMVDDLQSYSRLRSGTMPDQMQPFDLAPLVGGLSSEYRYIGQTQGIRLRYEEQPGLPDVCGDREWITRAMRSLFTVCLRFAARNDEITVTVGARGDEVCMRIVCPGVPQTLAGALSRLWAGEDVQVPCGLDTAARVVGYALQRQGGRVAATVEPGGIGLEMGLKPACPGDLPAQNTHAAPPRPVYPRDWRLHQPGTQEWTVLLVDQTPATVHDIADVLAPFGFSLEGFCSSRAARDYFDGGGRADAAVIRTDMPELSGLELCAYIRARRKLHELPVLLVTADSAGVTHALQAGANVCIAEPYDMLILRANVSTLVQLRRTALQAQENETAFLQAQIKPHFLFNALNAIESYAYTDPEKNAEIVGELAAYLRYTFDGHPGKQQVPLTEELDFTHAYLQLEQARFEDRVNFVFDVKETEDVFISPFLIQPLAENAVRHGLLPRMDGGCVTVRGRREDGLYRVEVIDNGVGMSPDRVDEVLHGVHPDGTGVGLRNVRRRLKQFYGSSFSIESTPGQGTRISFCLPAKSKKGEETEC